MKKRVFIDQYNQFFTLRSSDIKSAKKIALTSMRTSFNGHRVIKHLFALILLNDYVAGRDPGVFFFQFTTFHFEE